MLFDPNTFFAGTDNKFGGVFGDSEPNMTLIFFAIVPFSVIFLAELVYRCFTGWLADGVTALRSKSMILCSKTVCTLAGSGASVGIMLLVRSSMNPNPTS